MSPLKGPGGLRSRWSLGAEEELPITEVSLGENDSQVLDLERREDSSAHCLLYLDA